MKSKSTRITWGGILVPVGGIVSLILFACVGKDTPLLANGTDASSTQDAADTGDGLDAGDGGQRCTAAMPFKSALPLGDNINTSAIEMSGTLTSDEKTIVFTRNDDDGLQLYMATRALQTDDFGPSSRLDLACDPPCTNYNSQLSASGDSMVFASVRDGNNGRIFQAQRVGDGFTNVTPIYADPTVVGNAPFLTGEGELFFTSGDDKSMAIFRSLKASDGSFPPAEQVQAFATADGPSDTGPVLSRDGLTMYFSSTYPYLIGDSQANWHTFVMERATVNDPFGVPAPVDELRGVDGSAAEMPSWLSDDGCRLYFSVVRDGDSNIYVASKL
ncbi:MAG: hypothetical protein FWD69_12975 [Polyangiaceae bacterium]|nr:hypothetical protein [Polyangiaceae bacterium]